MTSNDRATLLMPEVRLAPTELAKIPAVVLVEGLATPREVAPPREEPQP